MFSIEPLLNIQDGKIGLTGIDWVVIYVIHEPKEAARDSFS